MTTEDLIREANEYAARVGQVGDPQLRPANMAIAKIAFLAGLRTGIQYFFLVGVALSWTFIGLRKLIEVVERNCPRHERGEWRHQASVNRARKAARQ
jgi:hypothetical protein